MVGVLNRIRAIRGAAETGTTMIEVIAGMAVMTIFLALFSGAMLSIFRNTNYVQSASLSSSQTNNAFLQLDKLIRYASSISSPSTTPTTAGNYYVELQTGYTGASTCTQLQLNVNNKTLKSRTWTVGASAGTYSNLTTFRMLANGVTSSGAPFVLNYGSGYVFEQLAVSLSSTNGVNPPQTTGTSLTYIAINSADANTDITTQPAKLSGVCQETSRP